MKSFASILDAADISTRPKRRRAVSLIVDALISICNAETAYRDRIPENLMDSDAYAAADESIDSLTDAIDALMSAF